MNDLTDEEIAHNVKNGDIDAFGLLVDRYEKKITRYAYKFLSGNNDLEDIVQEVFIKAYSNIQSFDTARSFSSWLYRVAHNEFVNNLKKKKRNPLHFFDPDTLFPHPISPERTDKALLEQETRDMLNVCLEEYDPKYREPLVLYYFEELGYKEISDILKIPVSTVGVRIRRGKESLKKLCQKNGYEL